MCAANNVPATVVPPLAPRARATAKSRRLTLSKFCRWRARAACHCPIQSGWSRPRGQSLLEQRQTHGQSLPSSPQVLSFPDKEGRGSPRLSPEPPPGGVRTVPAQSRAAACKQEELFSSIKSPDDRKVFLKTGRGGPLPGNAALGMQLQFPTASLHPEEFHLIMQK
jgi:hypothetical protein